MASPELIINDRRRQKFYIPRPGAMQFEVTKVRRVGCDAAVGHVLWVEREKTAYSRSQNPLCACDKFHRIILESVPLEILDIVMARAHLGHPVVCMCVGRIIE